MDNKEFSKILENRTLKFAIAIIKLAVKLPTTTEGKVVRSHITRSGTSIGANYREANRCRSRADFRNKIKICESEASETKYWLEIISELKWSANEISPVMEECKELLAIFTSVGKKVQS